jgi:hypothetical protein
MYTNHFGIVFVFLWSIAEIKARIRIELAKPFFGQRLEVSYSR